MKEILETPKPSKKKLLILANQKIEKLEEQLKNEIRYKEMYQKNAKTAEAQIEEIHDFLDGLPGAMAKEKSSSSTNKISTRLLSWIAHKASI
jgi:hypothetical protein